MPKLQWTSQAESDLEEIVFYLGVEQNRRSTARKIAHEIHAKCEIHAASPSIGTPCSHLGKGYRIFSHKRWVVVFCPIEDGIEVVRVVDGSRDYGRLFE